MKNFVEVVKSNQKKLDLYVPVVARVHGGTHPEFHEVKRIYDDLAAKIKEADESKPDLNAEFEELRTITTDYLVPGDVCESYEAVYQMLQELDEAYSK